MNNNKYINLKQLLIDGKNDKFDIELSKLSFDELIKFSLNEYTKSNKKAKFSEDYYGAKILGEMCYLIITRALIIQNKKDTDLDKFKQMINDGLNYASKIIFELGYYNDAEKYFLSIIKYTKLNNTEYLHYLSKLAGCSHHKNDKKQELLYCEKMLEIDYKDPKILTNYAYALMRNKKFDEAKINLEKCLNIGYKSFAVYNQLLNVSIYGFNDFNKAFLYIEEISDVFNGGKDLNDREQFLLNYNFLSIAGFSGDKKLLDKIIEFKEDVKNISIGFYEVAQNSELINKGIFELNNKNYINAKKYFDEVKETKINVTVKQYAEFLSNICKILNEYQNIKGFEDINKLLDFIKTIKTVELFQDYKDIIENYFYLLSAFAVLIKEDTEIVELDFRKNKIKKFNILNLVTSEFINKSFELVKMIESYIEDYKESILSENIKDEYENKLNKLIDSSFNTKNEISLLYSSSNKQENINQELCKTTIKTMKLLQRNEPSFIKDYKLGKSTLKESDFRDNLSMILSFTYNVSSEANSRGGRTDLQIQGDKFGTKIFEFKIWGRNDYKDIVKQAYEYLTDFDDVGFIFMINSNKSCIKKEYINNLKKETMGYIQNSLEKQNINNFEILISEHKINIKTKKIYHFVYNIY